MIRARDIAGRRPLVYVAPSDTVRTAAKRMAEKNIGATPVLDEDRLVGIFTERDLVMRVVAKDQNPDKTRVDAVMTKQVVTAEPSETIDECIQKMQSIRCRHLPVVEDGKLLGILSLRDVLQVEFVEKSEKVDLLNELVTYSADYES